MTDKSSQPIKTIREQKAVVVHKVVSDEKFKPKGAVAFLYCLS